MAGPKPSIKKTPKVQIKSLKENILQICENIQKCKQDDKKEKKEIVRSWKNLRLNKTKTKKSLDKLISDDQIHRNELYKLLNKLTDSAIQKCEFVDFTDMALDIVAAQFRLLKLTKIYQGKNKMNKLVLLSQVAVEIANAMANIEKAENFKKLYSIIEDIVRELQDINDDELGEKCKQVSWTLFYYANCCNHLRDFRKSFEIANRAICLLRTAYDVRAETIDLMAYCYETAFLSLCSFADDESKVEEWKKKALDVVHKVDLDEEKKKKCITKLENIFNKRFPNARDKDAQDVKTLSKEKCLEVSAEN